MSESLSSEDARPMRVSVIILNWNGAVDDCIESVRSAVEQTYADKEIIFVDNGSTNGSFEAVQVEFPDLIYLRLEANIGCPGGRNRGAEIATGDILMYLENDGAWGSDDVVSGAVRMLQLCPDVGALYTRVEDYRTGVADPPLDRFGQVRSGAVSSSSFRGGASAIRAGLFRQAGGFPADFVYGGEERFLSWKIYQLGYTVAYWPERTMRHKGSDYSGKSDIRMQRVFVNDVRTIMRLYPLSWKLWYLPAKLVWYGLRFLRRGKIKEFCGLVNAVLRASPEPQGANRLSGRVLWRVNRIRYGLLRRTYPVPAVDKPRSL